MGQVQVQEEGPQLSSEELKQRDKEAMLQAEVDREHEEQMRKLREKKRKEKEPPPPPKTITVMAGSRNRPAWPIAPGIANANQPRQITLETAEDVDEMNRNRIQVAEAAGLKHVDVTVGEQADIYGQGHQGGKYLYISVIYIILNFPISIKLLYRTLLLHFIHF